MAKKRPGPQKMSDKHKAALAQGREEGRAVRHYLEALRSDRSRRGRKRTPESIERRLAVIAEELTGADPVSELKLVQGGCPGFCWSEVVIPPRALPLLAWFGVLQDT